MSRIDHALRHAAGMAGTLAGEPLAPPAAAAEVLESYPVEHAAAPPEPMRAGTVPGAAAGRGTAALRDLETSLKSDRLSVEQYARLAAVLDDAAVTHRLKTVVVSSAVPREGKTLTVANLALTLVNSYRQRVVAIDADLRRPSLHTLFGVGNDRGLAEWLESPGKTLPVRELSPSLAIVPAGRATNPMAVLASDAMKQLIERLADAFDWVLVDTSPVVVSDGQLVARHADGVLLVIGAGATSYRLVERAIATIGADRVLGAVLNRAERKHVPASGYYADYYDDAGS